MPNLTIARIRTTLVTVTGKDGLSSMEYETHTICVCGTHSIALFEDRATSREVSKNRHDQHVKNCGCVA